MREQGCLEIGNISIDTSCDTGKISRIPVDEREIMFRVARELSAAEYISAMDSYGSEELLRGFSHLRENVIEWLPISMGERVLEIGSGVGARTGALARAALQVDCVCDCLDEARIAAYRYEMWKNIRIFVGEATKVCRKLTDTYDWIVCEVGSVAELENLLTQLHKGIISDGGKVVALLSASAKADGDGLQKWLENGDRGAKLLYPVPDMEFAQTIYSEKSMNAAGLCAVSLDCILYFGDEIDFNYIRYSNDRSPELQIKTVELADGNYCKIPCTAESGKHLQKMETSYRLLSDRFAGGELNFAACTWNERLQRLDIPRIEGTPLSAMLDLCVANRDEEGFHKLFREFTRRISYRDEVPVVDLDLIFSNILIDGDNWQVIDYEWVLDEAVSPSELAFRSLYCYFLEDESRNVLDTTILMQELGVDEILAKQYREAETAFQKRVTGKHIPLAVLREKAKHFVGESQAEENASELLQGLQVYVDRGTGFTEENSASVSEKDGVYRIVLGADVKRLRFDPCNMPCVVQLGKVLWNEEPVRVGALALGGKKIGENRYAFFTDDPGFMVRLGGLARNKSNRLEIQMTVEKLPEVLPKDGKIVPPAAWLVTAAKLAEKFLK